MEQELDLYAIWLVLKKRWKLIIIIPLVAALISTVYSLYVVIPQYETSTTLMVMRRIEVDEVQYDDIRVSRQLAETYREIVHSHAVLAEAIASNALPYTVGALRGKINVESVRDTEIFNITAQDPDPAMAAEIANGVASAFQKQAMVLMDMENINVIDPAREPGNPVTPRLQLNIAVALMVGLLGAVGLTFMFEYLDRSIRDPEEASRLLEIPVLGVIPKREDKKLD